MKKLFEDVSVIGLNAVTYAIPFAELEQVLKIISPQCMQKKFDCAMVRHSKEIKF